MDERVKQQGNEWVVKLILVSLSIILVTGLVVGLLINEVYRNNISAEIAKQKMVKFLENEPVKSTITLEKLKLLETKSSGRIKFEEVKERVHFNLNFNQKNIMKEFTEKSISIDNFPQFISLKTTYRSYKKTDFYMNLQIWRTLNKRYSMSTPKDNK